MPTFVLNDETQTNSYGFRVLNSGISLTRFSQNPVMLKDHGNSTENVIGRWKNLSVSGNTLTAESDFDEEDLTSNSIAGKVERGFIKGASMGISFSPADMHLSKDGVYELTKCDLFEASICAIPSNANSLSLFATNGVRLSDSEINLQLSSIKTSNMNLSNTLIGMLGLTAGSTDQSIIESVTKLLQDNKAEKETKIEKMLTLAVREYNLDATEHEFWKQAALSDYDKVEKMLLAPNKKRISLSASVNNVGQNEDKAKWTLEDYRLNDPKALETNPTLFEKLYAQEKNVKAV